jgi:hypothetical protein
MALLRGTLEVVMVGTPMMKTYRSERGAERDGCAMVLGRGAAKNLLGRTGAPRPNSDMTQT